MVPDSDFVKPTMSPCNLSAGSDFPTGIGRHTSLYYKDSFLVLGGLGGHDCQPACADTSTTGNCGLLPIVAGYDAPLVGTMCNDDGAGGQPHIMSSSFHGKGDEGRLC